MMMKREEWSTERSDKPRRYEILVHAAHISRAKKEKKNEGFRLQQRVYRGNLGNLFEVDCWW